MDAIDCAKTDDEIANHLDVTNEIDHFDQHGGWAALVNANFGSEQEGNRNENRQGGHDDGNVDCPAPGPANVAAHRKVEAGHAQEHEHDDEQIGVPRHGLHQQEQKADKGKEGGRDKDEPGDDAQMAGTTLEMLQVFGQLRKLILPQFRRYRSQW